MSEAEKLLSLSLYNMLVLVSLSSLYNMPEAEKLLSLSLYNMLVLVSLSSLYNMPEAEMLLLYLLPEGRLQLFVLVGML